MENGGIKNIVLIALVVVFSFFLGSLAVDGWKDALLPSVLIIGVFIMLYLGKNSKNLVFYLPRIVTVLGFTVGGNDVGTLIIDAVFAYWILMRLMGYIRFQWVGHLLMDGVVVVLFLYMCVSFYRNPVAMQVLGLDLDEVGGADYVSCLLGVVAYIAISCIPFTAKELGKVVRNLAFLHIGLSFVQIALRMKGFGGGSMDGLGDAAQNSRFNLFSRLGTGVFALVYALYPLRKIVASPWKMVVLGLCVLSVFMSGWRGTIITFVIGFYVLAFFKRELTFFLCLGGFCYAGLLFLSSEHAFNGLPFGIQRSLCAIPGVHVSKRVERDAEGSSDWRKEMWGWALDPRTGYIKDYVWGDGPGMSQAKTARFMTAVMRGKANGGDNVYFAAAGIWHSGWITTMHRFGIVGLVLAAMYQLVWCAFSLLSCLRYRSSEFFPYIAVLCRSSIPTVVLYHLGAGLPTHLFTVLPTMALYKQLYVRARELGRDDSFFRSEPYTPLMIQDINAQEKKQQDLVNV